MVMLSLFTRCGYSGGRGALQLPAAGRRERRGRSAGGRGGRKNTAWSSTTSASRPRPRRWSARASQWRWRPGGCATPGSTRLSHEHGYTAVAIAHHADDSIETFFINLLRGTGLRGLTGISTQVGKIIRPLLFASRREILEYAVQNRIPFREDSSNRSTKYLRNKIRLGLIPRIREINPKFTSLLMSRNLARLTDAQLFINHGIERIRGEAVTSEPRRNRHDPPRSNRPGVPARVRDLRAAQLGLRVQGRRGRLRCAAPWSRGPRDGGSTPGSAWPRIDRGANPSWRRSPRTTTCLTTVPPGRPAQLLRQLGALLRIPAPLTTVRTFDTPPNVALLDADRLRYPAHAAPLAARATGSSPSA